MAETGGKVLKIELTLARHRAHIHWIVKCLQSAANINKLYNAAGATSSGWRLSRARAAYFSAAVEIRLKVGRFILHEVTFGLGRVQCDLWRLGLHQADEASRVGVLLDQLGGQRAQAVPGVGAAGRNGRCRV